MTYLWTRTLSSLFYKMAAAGELLASSHISVSSCEAFVEILIAQRGDKYLGAWSKAAKPAIRGSDPSGRPETKRDSSCVAAWLYINCFVIFKIYGISTNTYIFEKLGPDNC